MSKDMGEALDDIVDMIFEKRIKDFAIESNFIEQISEEKKHIEHYDALRSFLKLDKLTVKNIEKFVSTIQPNAILRTTQGVRIGNHIAPSGEKVKTKLKPLLDMISKDEIDPWEAHLRYEYLHPFTDGNGRSGRAIWLWQMTTHREWGMGLGFRHKFYYDTLGNLKDQIKERLGL
jgi:Fic family protein